MGFFKTNHQLKIKVFYKSSLPFYEFLVIFSRLFQLLGDFAQLRNLEM